MPADPSAAAVPHVHADLLAVVRQAVAEVATPPELLDVAAVLALTTQGRTSLYRALAAGEFPQPVQTPSGKRWRRKDVLKWVDGLKT